MKNSKQKKQQGFTLIELMIVVAVIGVLAAIAIPQYQKYVAKSEVASALATLTGVKTNVEAYAAFPDGSTADQTEADLGVPSTIPSGVIAFSTASSAGGTIKFTFNASGVSNLITSKNFELVRASDGTWTCQGSSASPVTDDLLPKNCR